MQSDRHKGGDKAGKYDVGVMPLRTEMAVLSQELIALRAESAVRSDSDVGLIAKCQKG